MSGRSCRAGWACCNCEKTPLLDFLRLTGAKFGLTAKRRQDRENPFSPARGEIGAYPFTAACAAANLAIGTRKGEQDT